MAMKDIITITERAADRIKSLTEKPMVADQTPQQAIRIVLANRGCSGKSYEVEYAGDPKPHEEVIEQRGVKIYIDPAAIMFLIGTEMDWVEDKFSSSFQFKNPNEKGRCGCGESFMI